MHRLSLPAIRGRRLRNWLRRGAASARSRGRWASWGGARRHARTTRFKSCCGETCVVRTLKRTPRRVFLSSAGDLRLRGDSVEVWTRYEEFAYRLEFWGDEVERLSIINPTSGEVIDKLEQVYIYPAKHFVLPEERIHSAVDDIRKELRERLELFKS